MLALVLADVLVLVGAVVVLLDAAWATATVAPASAPAGTEDGERPQLMRDRMLEDLLWLVEAIQSTPAR